jgi:hypothetical protein
MKTPELTPIEKSSTITGYHYDPDPQILHVQFRGGATYAYTRVPIDVATEFELADSKGRFFHASIRNDYPSMRLDLIRDDDDEAVAAAHKFLKGAADERAA